MKKITKNYKFANISICVMLIFSSLAIALPAVLGQNIENKTTYALCGANPNPIGVNQEVLIHVGITDYLQISTQGWTGLTVTVTKPDGNTETLGPFTTDATGSTGTVYIPTQAGTYTFQTHFPETEYTVTVPPIFQPDLLGTTILYEASDSEIVELEVQTDPVHYYPGSPLPSEYWTRPIDAQHWEWSTISGNWVTTPPNMFAPNNDFAPETPHILWAEPLTTGGLVGGEFGNHGFDGGDAYEGKFLTWDTHSGIILAGVLYFNRHQHRGDFSIEKEVVAVDLRTGEELWAKNLGHNETLAFGQLLQWDSINMHSTFEYLWTTDGTVDIYVFGFKVAEGVFPGRGSTWKAFDPFTGRWEYTIENVPSGQMIRGPKGEILIYTIDSNSETLTKWNSSRAYTPDTISGSGMWRPEGNTYDGMTGIEWNITLPSGLQTESTPLSDFIVLEDRIIGSTAQALQTVIGDPTIVNWGVSTKPGHEGELLFKTEWQPPAGDLNFWQDCASLEDGIFTLWSKEQRANYAFNLDTGAYLWGPTDSQVLLDVFGIENFIAYGKLFSVGMGGVVYAYDLTTGNRLWDYVANDPYSEILWSNNWPLHVAFITDGKIYLTHSEHSVVDPKPRGAPFICLDVENGNEIWRVDGAFRGTDWGGRAIIGDSIIALYNTYDERIYAVGKGPSEISVKGPDEVQSLGTPILLTGMVTDVSAGTKSSSLMSRFPNGVPAIDDSQMGDWMKYVYAQFPRPTNAIGVEVKLEAYDPNGNYQNLGSVTTDSNGNYGFLYDPEVPGAYYIFATFEGTNAYYGSSSSTYIGVGEALTPSTPIEPEQPVSEAFITTEIAIILAVIAVAVIGIVGYLVLKKRK